VFTPTQSRAATMVTVTVHPAGKVTIARGLPFTVELPDKDANDLTIADVKAGLSKRFPQASPMIVFCT